MVLVSLKSTGRHRLFQHIVNMRKSTVSRGLPPFFKISGRCHLAQEISCSWDLWLQVSHLPWWKGYPVLEGQVSVAGWIMPNSWRELVGNRWRYSDLTNVPVAQTRSAPSAASKGDTFFGIGPMTSRIPLPVFLATLQGKCRTLLQQSKKCASLAAMFFSHRIKLVGSNISFRFSHRMFLFCCYQQPLPRCIICHRCLRSTVTCSKTPEEELLPACSTSTRESNYHDSQGEN